MNNDTITTRTIKRGFADVDEEFVLEDTAQTRIIFKAQIHNDGVRGCLYRYKKDVKGNIDAIMPVDFRQLHANEGVMIELRTATLAALYQRFTELTRLLEEQGIHNGERSFTIADANALVIKDENKAVLIRKLLDDNLGEEIWNQLVANSPDIATRLANAQLLTDRMTVLRQFEEMLDNDSLREDSWQDFFEANTWIFGYSLRYQILRVVQTQPHYGGADISGKGGQRGDFLTATEAETKFTCLVEIKKPTTSLLQNSEYRNGAWGVSSELSGAISQIQINCAKWEISGSREDDNRDRTDKIYTVAPRGIVVVGNTNQLSCRGRVNSFERYRNSLHNPEIITFDELYQRAKFIVNDDQEPIETDDELPF
jgi:hypothetical protein